MGLFLSDFAFYFPLNLASNIVRFAEMRGQSRHPIVALLLLHALPQLTALYLMGCTTPQVSWTLTGMAIRLAQDVGAHRRKVYNTVPSVEGELWKRAFW